MIEWFEEFWMYAVGLVVVFIVTMFVFKKAGAAYSNHNKTFKAQEAQLKRLVELKNKYQYLDEKIIKSADESELLEGVALSYQLKLQKSESDEEEFKALSKEKQFIYALDIFIQDAPKRAFFTENGAILKDIICEALELIGEESFSAKVKPIARMYDDKDEETSINQKNIDEFFEYMEKNNVCQDIKLKAAIYIKENSEKFYND